MIIEDIIRPDMRRFEILDVLIEFKFVTLKDAGVSGEKARQMSQEELRAMPPMVEAMSKAREQVRTNAGLLHKRRDNLRLHGYAVVSLGFERIWWEEVSGTD
jgi:hypothetical protein